jgi:hypothetical protein
MGNLWNNICMHAWRSIIGDVVAIALPCIIFPLFWRQITNQRRMHFRVYWFKVLFKKLGSYLPTSVHVLEICHTSTH